MTPAPPAPPLSERAQAAALRLLLRCVRALGPVAASNAGGWIARCIGPLLPVSNVADANLRRALPGLDRAARRRVIRGVWDNLGRTAAELPHMAGFRQTDTGPGWEVTGLEHMAVLQNGPALVVSGHIGNWEMMLPISAQLGLTVSGVYRPASNRAVDAVIQQQRRQAMKPSMAMFGKGARGARLALAHLAGGGSLGMLADQKMNDGIAAPFFGRMAMTASAPAQFALRFRIPVMPVRVDRIGPARFRMVFEAPLPIPASGDRAADVLALTITINQMLERWIRADPASWLWLHRRWPKTDAP